MAKSTPEQLEEQRKYRQSEKGQRKAREYWQSERGREASRRSFYKTSRLAPQRFKRSQTRAQRKGRTWTLTFDEYSSLLQQPCFYCEGPLPETGVGLDRVDTLLGYDPGNVVPCCRTCNAVKGDQFTKEEAKAMLEVVAQMREESSAL